MIAAALVALLLVGGYRLAGGGGYRPSTVPSPCLGRHWGPVNSLGSAENELALSALDGAACRLHTSAADLALALGDNRSLAQFQTAHHISNTELAAATQAGVDQAISDGERSGAIDSTVATVLRYAVGALPEHWLLDQAKQLLNG